MKNKLTLAIILEAAGSSERFGSNKLLHIMGNGQPMISGILSAVSEVASKRRDLQLRKILVTQYDEIERMAADDYIVVRNYHPEDGISLSMKLGINAAGDVSAYMFCVCDQPGITPSTLCRLIDAYISETEKKDDVIVSLAWQGHMSNPKIFSSAFRDELLSLTGDTGGRQIISAHADDLIIVEANCKEEIIDMDMPQGSRSLPSE